jgi:glycosyltransferase involved in cell wall biosynthesis
MKRTLILSANAIPRRGGQGLNLYHMIRGLGQSLDLSVFCRGTCEDTQTYLVPESRLAGLIHKVPIIRRRRDWQTILSDTHFDRYVSVRLFPADLFQGVVGQCAESLAAAKSYGCRTVLDVLNTHIDDLAFHVERECAKFQVRSFIHPRMKARIRREYERADLIRVMSSHAQRTFLERGFPADRLVVAPPPIDFDQFSPATFSEPVFRVIFVGLLEPWKGFHDLIEAFDSLWLPDSELVLWGSPGARPITRYLQQRMAHNPAILIRPLEVAQVGYAHVYGRASVLAHPSLSDGFSYVVAEAMASGLPVIVTRNTGAADLVIDGQNGYVIAPGDGEALRDRLAHLAQHPSLLREMGQAARASARQLTFEAFRQCYLPRLAALC